MSEITNLVEQLQTDVGAVGFRLLSLIGSPDEIAHLDQRLEQHAQVWAAELLGDDDRLAAQTAIDLINLLWPHSDISAEWWSTPLGHATARSVGHPTAEVISYAVAAAMLGCSKQHISKLIEAGRLHRAPSGGVTSASVRSELRAVETGTRQTWRTTPRLTTGVTNAGAESH